MKNQSLNLPPIKKKPEIADLLVEEYDFIVACLNHGTSLIGITENERRRHDKIVKWLEGRKNEILKTSKKK